MERMVVSVRFECSLCRWVVLEPRFFMGSVGNPVPLVRWEPPEGWERLIAGFELACDHCVELGRIDAAIELTQLNDGSQAELRRLEKLAADVIRRRTDRSCSVVERALDETVRKAEDLLEDE